jgi:hypothetical protein
LIDTARHHVAAALHPKRRCESRPRLAATTVARMSGALLVGPGADTARREREVYVDRLSIAARDRPQRRRPFLSPVASRGRRGAEQRALAAVPRSLRRTGIACRGAATVSMLSSAPTTAAIPPRRFRARSALSAGIWRVAPPLTAPEPPRGSPTSRTPRPERRDAPTGRVERARRPRVRQDFNEVKSLGSLSSTRPVSTTSASTAKRRRRERTARGRPCSQNVLRALPVRAERFDGGFPRRAHDGACTGSELFVGGPDTGESGIYVAPGTSRLKGHFLVDVDDLPMWGFERSPSRRSTSSRPPNRSRRRRGSLARRTRQSPSGGAHALSRGKTSQAVAESRETA